MPIYKMISSSKIFYRFFKKSKKPRVLMLLDNRGWAFDNSAQEIAKRLSERYNFDFKYVNDNPKPKLKSKNYDIIYVFFWGEKYHTKFNFSKYKTIKEVSSHRWIDDVRFGPCTTEEMVTKYLNDAGTIICTSKKLVNEIKEYHNRVFHTPNGVDLNKFYYKKNRTGLLRLGWAGNIKDSVKGYTDVIEPACKDYQEISLAPGNLDHDQMNDFYNELDVLVIASRHEGEPLTLIEAMAAGCFPVCTNVGIVTELVEHKVNGYIVKERTTKSFREAFEWCEVNLAHIRLAGSQNAEYIKKIRSWDKASAYFDNVFSDVLSFGANK